MIRALVTGGSGSIGAAICRELAQAGMEIVVHAHSHPDKAQQVVDEIRASGGAARVLSFDIADGAAARDALEALLAEAPVQVLVNNAGIYQDAPMAGMSEDVWRRVIDVSLHGFFHVTQPLLLPMLRTRWGRIVNISSVSAQIGNRGQTNYSAAKAGLIGATLSLARELASRGVTVNAVAPGIIESPLTENVFSDEAIKSLVPMQRAGTVEEVAHLVAFLCSERASYITGQVIGINGGMA